MKKYQHILFLLFFLFIVFVGSYLRFSSFRSRGMGFYDEGVYFLETKFLNEGFRYIVHNGLSHNLDFDSLRRSTEGVPLIMAKPGYNFILFLFSCFLGMHDYIMPLSSAVFGIINLLLLFFIARVFYNKWVGLLSMAVASVSAYNVFYSTVGLPEMVGATFLLIGILAYFYSIKYPFRLFYLVLCGLGMGYAFACNWRWSFLFFVIIFFESLRLPLKQIHIVNYIKRFFVFALTFLIPLFVFEIPYLILRLFKDPLPFRSYFQQLFERYSTHIDGKLISFSLTNNLVFAEYFLKIEGIIFVIAFFTGIIVLARDSFKDKKIQDIMLFALSIFPLLFFSFFQYNGYVLSRTISITILLSSIVIARLITALKWPLLVYSIIVFTLFLGFRQSYPVPHITSGYRQACLYIKEKGYKQLFILDSEPVFRAYVGRIAYLPYQRPRSLSNLVFQSKITGINRLVVDFNVLYSKQGQSYVQAIVNTTKPEKIFYNGLSSSFVHLTELYPYEIIKQILKDQRSRYIYIYNLAEYQTSRKD